MSGWQPIESAPKDGTILLLYGRTNEPRSEPDVEIGWWVIDPPGWEIVRTYAQDEPIRIDATHWQPLPEPPK